MFFLLYRHTDDGIFYDFPQISDHFPKILQNLPAGHPNVAEHVRKTSKDYQRLPETFGKDSKMFRSHTNGFSTI